MWCRICSPARQIVRPRNSASAGLNKVEQVVGDEEPVGVVVAAVVALGDAVDPQLGRVVQRPALTGVLLLHAAADHEQAGGACLDLDVGQLAEVRDRVDHHIGLLRLGAFLLVLHQAEAR